jgi:hypothetical protein
MIYQFFKIDHYRNDFIPLLPTKLPPLTRGFGVKVLTDRPVTVNLGAVSNRVQSALGP